MKKIVLFAVFGMVFPIFAFAFTGRIPFGGRVTAIHIPPNVGCYTDLTSSPFTLMPVSLVPPLQWSKMYGEYNVGLILPSAWMIGLYIPSSECVQVNGPEANPYPTLQTDFYGTSIPKPINVPFL